MISEKIEFETITSEVPSRYLGSLLERFDRINRKLEKKGLSPFKIEVSQPYEVHIPVQTKEGVIKTFFTANKFTIQGQPFKFGNFRVLLEVDHRESPPLLNFVPGSSKRDSLVSQPNLSENNCDHCKKAIQRNKIFWINDDSNPLAEPFRVGGSCAEEFLNGLSPTEVSRCMGLYEEASEIAKSILNIGMEDIGNDDLLANKGYYLPEVVYLLSENAIKKFGYVSKAKSEREFLSSTAENIIYDYSDISSHATFTAENANGIARAKDSLLKIKSLIAEKGTDASDFEINLMNSVQPGEFVSRKYIGFLAYAPVYIQTLEQEVALKSRQANGLASSHIGLADEKIEGFFQLRKSIPYDTQFGVSYVHLFTQKDTGNEVKISSTKGPSALGVKVKEWAYMQFTVKDHVVYKGVNQTNGTRASVVFSSESELSGDSISARLSAIEFVSSVSKHEKLTRKAKQSLVDFASANLAVSGLISNSICDEILSLDASRQNVFFAGLEFLGIGKGFLNHVSGDPLEDFIRNENQIREWFKVFPSKESLAQKSADIVKMVQVNTAYNQTILKCFEDSFSNDSKFAWSCLAHLHTAGFSFDLSTLPTSAQHFVKDEAENQYYIESLVNYNHTDSYNPAPLSESQVLSRIDFYQSIGFKPSKLTVRVQDPSIAGATKEMTLLELLSKNMTPSDSDINKDELHTATTSIQKSDIDSIRSLIHLNPDSRSAQSLLKAEPSQGTLF